MEKKMEATGILGIIRGLGFGIMEKNMETKTKI